MADFTEALFLGANLTNADFRGAILLNTNFQHAKLIQANFSQTNMTGANLYDTRRDGWNIEDSQCEYVFCDWNREHRVPEHGDFKPGEFEEQYQEMQASGFSLNMLFHLFLLMLNRVFLL